MWPEISTGNAGFDVWVRDPNESVVRVIYTDVGYWDSELEDVIARAQA